MNDCENRNFGRGQKVCLITAWNGSFQAHIPQCGNTCPSQAQLAKCVIGRTIKPNIWIRLGERNSTLNFRIFTEKLIN
jgi:hypothetical protein